MESKNTRGGKITKQQEMGALLNRTNQFFRLNRDSNRHKQTQKQFFLVWLFFVTPDIIKRHVLEVNGEKSKEDLLDMSGFHGI